MFLKTINFAHLDHWFISPELLHIYLLKITENKCSSELLSQFNPCANDIYALGVVVLAMASLNQILENSIPKLLEELKGKEIIYLDHVIKNKMQE